jgi:hypothetical protein
MVRTFVVVTFSILVALGVSGCKEETAMEKAQRAVEEAAEDVADAAEDLAEEAEEELD